MINTQNIETNINFNGNIIVKNKISTTQRSLFNAHKKSLDAMIKDLPFNLHVEQSKSRKTIQISADVENADKFIVRKNKQYFEKAAGYAIADGKRKSEAYNKLLRANNMFDKSKNLFLSIVLGNFKDARGYEKDLAKLAVSDFDTYKELPKVNFSNVPFAVAAKTMYNGFRYNIYKLFSKKTPEEKEFAKKRTDYLKTLKIENKQIKTVNINIPNYY